MGKLGRKATNHFNEKVAVITGAGSGIGRATAKLLAERGALVHVVDVDKKAAEAVTAEIRVSGRDATSHAVDVSDPNAVRSLADRLYENGGRVDVLHNNAGIGHVGPTEDVALELWRRMVDVNLMGVVHGIHAFGPRMLAQEGGGHILNTASGVGLFPTPMMLPYTATKEAVVGISEALNAEWSPRGVYVTALCPGIVNTPITRKIELSSGLESQRERIVRTYERFGATPEEVAGAALDAIRRRQLIRTVPRRHVIPMWYARRVSPRLAQPLGRLGTRIFSPASSDGSR